MDAAGTRKTVARVLKTDAVTDEVLEDVANRLYVSKSNALRMAVGAFADLTDEMATGAQVIVRNKDGQERQISFPFPALRPR